jgi:hypothetical protein
MRSSIRIYLRLAGLALVLSSSFFAVNGKAESSDQCIQQYNSCTSGCPIGGGPEAAACEAHCQQVYSDCSQDPPNQGVPPGPGLGEPGCTCSITCLRIDCIP